MSTCFLHSARVDMVFVGGETLVENGEVIGFDEEQAFTELQRSMDEIAQRIPNNDRLGRSVEDLMAPTFKKWEG